MVTVLYGVGCYLLGVWVGLRFPHEEWKRFRERSDG
jgi:hypothetical protein